MCDPWLHGLEGTVVLTSAPSKEIYMDRCQLKAWIAQSVKCWGRDPEDTDLYPFLAIYFFALFQLLNHMEIRTVKTLKLSGFCICMWLTSIREKCLREVNCFIQIVTRYNLSLIQGERCGRCLSFDQLQLPYFEYDFRRCGKIAANC